MGDGAPGLVCSDLGPVISSSSAGRGDTDASELADSMSASWSPYSVDHVLRGNTERGSVVGFAPGERMRD